MEVEKHLLQTLAFHLSSWTFSTSDQIDTVVLTDENGAQSLGGIEADSLGENSQVTLNTNAEKEAVMHELDDSGPVFNHDANVPNKAEETPETNDMSHYESEEINLVGNPQHKNVKTKPVRLPSLVEDGNAILLMFIPFNKPLLDL